MWFLREGQDVAIITDEPGKVTCPVCGRDSLVGEFNSLDIWGCQHVVDAIEIPGGRTGVIFGTDR